MAGPAWFVAGAIAVMVLFAAFAAIERGPGSTRMDDLNSRALARAVCENVSRTTPNFAPPPRRAAKCLLWAIGAAVVAAPFIAAAMRAL